MAKNLFIEFLVELIGTFILLVVIISTLSPIAIGLALVGLIYFSLISTGGFLNPAVSLMFYLNKNIDGTQLFVYVIAQLLGAVLAYLYWHYYLRDAKIEKNIVINLI